MKPNRSAIPASKAPCATLASRSTTRLKSPKRLMSDVPGQSCRALPSGSNGQKCATFGPEHLQQDRCAALPYSITSLARASSEDGTMIPSAWAVLRLSVLQRDTKEKEDNKMK